MAGRPPARQSRKSGSGKPSSRKSSSHLLAKLLLGSGVFVLVAGLLSFTYVYVKFARMIEEKLEAGPFPNTSMLFAAPKTVALGDEAAIAEIVAQLRRSNYTENQSNRMGYYYVKPNEIGVFPGPDSYFLQEAGVIRFAGNRVSQIISLRDNTERTEYQLEPELITNLFDRKREKRRIVKYEDIPKVLVNAVISAEDKRFFQHSGFDPLRIIRAAYIDVKEGRKDQGASTLSMQLARMFFLTAEKTWTRKFAETLLTLQLEHKLTKEQIFEYYANQIDLGRRGSFSIRGFGEAAQAYFGKDFKHLTIAEAATLAGLAQRPSYTNPFRWPDRAKTRRNIVLSLMRNNGYITDREYAVAQETPLTLAHGGGDVTDAPYFVDLVNDELQDRFQDHDFQERSYRVYTSLDLNLQREAVESIRIGMQEVDDQLRRRRRRNYTGPEPQVALIALDAQTAEVKALVGGRNYGMSQLNRALAKRQPGSAFKPFVYAAALQASLRDTPVALTPVTTVVDEPTTFWYDNKPYEPNNFKSEFHGVVTIRQALAKSMNIPTVKVAEAVGYDAVVDLARRAGMNLDIRPTPAVALGAYEVTPLEIAGAYTIYTNRGNYVRPNWLKHIRDDRGSPIYEYKPLRKPALDPRVAYLMVDLMEEVLRTGTGAGVRSRGFTLPAAGKTGTSHDGWFAGFTSKLICIVWVGYDEGSRVLELEGARSALPVWTEFMKRAHTYREYRNVRPFDAPDGIVSVEVDPMTGQLAAPGCPNARSEVFVTGTQPVELCRLHGGGRGGMQVAGWEASTPSEGSVVAANSPAATASPQTIRIQQPPQLKQAEAQPPKTEKPKEKRGFFGRIRDIFR
jgi:penicillin-binding protein 1B